jgi:hypothetical protein
MSAAYFRKLSRPNLRKRKMNGRLKLTQKQQRIGPRGRKRKSAPKLAQRVVLTRNKRKTVPMALVQVVVVPQEVPVYRSKRDGL